MSNQLTDEQVTNWRNVLAGMIGPYAFIMSREDIQLLRDKTQQFAQQAVATDATSEAPVNNSAPV